jgi:uncharacterized protein Yka (UPF0111/DUF47 family)
MMKNFKRILVVGEQNLFRELTEILELGIRANEVMCRMLSEGYRWSELDGAKQTIRSLAKQSDDIAFNVSEEITSGAVSPNILDDLLEAVNHADNILDFYYALSRELGRMSKADVTNAHLNYDAEWKPTFGILTDLAGKAISEAKEILVSSSLDSMTAIRKEILALKEQGDDVKNNGFDKLYSDASRLSYVEFRYYSEILHRFEYILAACKELSNLAVAIVNSIEK